MIVSPEPQDCPEFLKILLFDLEASSKLVRLAAIIQLARYATRPEVIESIKERLIAEDDGECRQNLQQIQRLGIFRKGNPSPPSAGLPRETSATPETPRTPETPGKNDLSTEILKAPEDMLPGLFAELEGLPKADRSRIVASVLAGKPSVGILLPLLEADETSFNEPSTLANLPGLLGHNHPLVVLRALSILSSISPDRVLDRLPDLLIHNCLQVRVSAIRLLHRLSPPEAIRLLDELLDSPEPGVVTTGLSLMFTFPFEEVSQIVCRLVEQQSIAGPAIPLIEGLIKTNPDAGFLSRLINLELRKPGETPFAAWLIPLAAEALSVSGLEKGTSAEVLERFTGKEKIRLSRLIPTRLSAPINEKPTAASMASPFSFAPAPFPTNEPSQLPLPFRPPRPPQPPQLSQPPVPSQPPLPSQPPQLSQPPQPLQPSPSLQPSMPAQPVQPVQPPTLAPSRMSQTHDFLRRCGSLPALNANDQADLTDLLPALKDPDEQVLGIALLHKHKKKDSAATGWLLCLLENTPLAVRLAAMDALADLAPRLLLPHLPLLGFSDQPQVATQAIRNLRRLEGSNFFRRLQSWINDPNPKSREVALIGLLQLDFSAARALVIAALRRPWNHSLIESFGVILLMNPEARTISELQLLIAGATGKRKNLLQNLQEEVRNNLRVINGSANNSGIEGITNLAVQAFQKLDLQEKLQGILEKIRDIHYRGTGPDEGPLINGPALLWTGAGVAFLLSIWIGIGWLFPSSDALETQNTDQVITTRMTKIAHPADISPGSRVSGELLGYDPINKQWKLKDFQGNTFKLRTQGMAGMNQGDKLIITVGAVVTSPLGYPTITPRFIDRVKP